MHLESHHQPATHRPPAHCAGRARHRRRGASAGFTLLEMLLATALSVVLLTTLWGFFSVYTNLFDKGQDRVESSQLVRSLMQQISEDLRAAIQDPIGGDTDGPPGQSPERRFGLFGSANELRFDVLQLTPMRANLTPVGDSRPAGDNAARVPELRTIHYQLRGAGPADDAEDVAQSGLLRRELDFESPAPDIDQTDLAAATGEPDSLALAVDGQQMPTDPIESPTAQLDDSFFLVPEVSAIEFRYFDGSTWTSQWNSIQRKSLPDAVEVTLYLAEETDAAPQAALPEGLPDEEGSFEADPAPQFRLVVDLPGSPTYREPRVARAASARPARPTVRRIAPPRWTPRQQTSRGADEWIRTGAR